LAGDTINQGRYRPAGEMSAASDWQISRLTPPSRLFCANGLRTGPDGRIYVAQVGGSQISAVHPDSGKIDTVSPMGGGIIGPDDLAFDDDGNLYATEITEGRVSMLAADGTTRVICGDMPVANPITYSGGRLIAGECRPGGRIMELDRHGGAPRVILDNVPMANAFEVGPDGKLYFPVMGTNEIWRVSLEGGRPETVVGGLAAPDSVKFDMRGNLVSTQAASGEVLRINPTTGERKVLTTIAPGLDNCTFVGERLFVSSISGQINEVLPDGAIRSLVPDGLQWPLGLAVDERGVLFIADGGYTYTLSPSAARQVAGMLFTGGFPGYTRGVASAGAGEWIVTTANGAVASFRPDASQSTVLAEGYEQLYGVAVRAGGGVVFADRAKGGVFAVDNSGQVSVLARDLDQPKGVAIDADGDCYVTESGAGHVVKIGPRGRQVILDGLTKPEGIAVRRKQLYVVDAAAKQLVEYDLDTGNRRTIAHQLPVGAPAGVIPKALKAFPPLCGAMGPFAGVTAAPDGTLYVSGDAEGSVLALRPASTESYRPA
jgi:sugar lactone lactonase YvrE